MHEVEIHVVSLQVLQCAVQCNRDVLRRMVNVPKLGGDEEIFTLDYALVQHSPETKPDLQSRAEHRLLWFRNSDVSIICLLKSWCTSPLSRCCMLEHSQCACNLPSRRHRRRRRRARCRPARCRARPTGSSRRC
uniref:Uncharacterized protein n=1 Tax=Zea mays TaxID=4577 RepID=C0PK63_MAIZE|nr:unknown [Zea mays]